MRMPGRIRPSLLNNEWIPGWRNSRGPTLGSSCVRSCTSWISLWRLKSSVVTRWEDRYVRVLMDGGHREFFDRFLQAQEVLSLVLITPWISSERLVHDQFTSTLQKIRGERIRT